MTPAINLARKHNIPHQLHEYAHDPAHPSYGKEAADKLGVDQQRVFKTLVARLDGKQLVVEIIQNDLFRRTAVELSRILHNTEYRAGMKEGYKALQTDLGKAGVSGRIGRRMVELLN